MSATQPHIVRAVIFTPKHWMATRSIFRQQRFLRNLRRHVPVEFWQALRSRFSATMVLGSLALVVTLAFLSSLLLTRPTVAQTNVAFVPGNDWPTYMGNAQRSAVNDETILSPQSVGNLVKRWVTPTGGSIATSPAIVNDTVYIGSWDGYEYALDALTGVVKWKTFLGQTFAKPCQPQTIGITSSATVVNNVVYVGGGDAYWYALNALTGAVLWRVFTGDTTDQTGGHYNWSSPLIVNGDAYIGIASNCDAPLVQGQLLQVSLTTHTVTHVLNLVPDGQVGGGIWSSPTFDEATNTIYVTTGTQNLISQNLAQSIVAVDATNLTVKSYWHLPLSQAGTDSDWGTTPVLATDASGGRLVIATNKNGFTYAFDAAHLDAGPRWMQQVAIGGECPTCGDGSISSAIAADSQIFQAGGNAVMNNTGYLGSVRDLDPATGSIRWQHGDLQPIIPAMAYTNGLLIVGAGQTLEVLDAATGQRLYAYNTGGMILGAPAVAHGIIYVGSQDGQMLAFGLAPSIPTPSDAHCPMSWRCQDVGNAEPTGQENDASEKWDVSGGGAGIGSYTDQFHFLQQQRSGDQTLTVQIDRNDNLTANAQIGLMFRQNSFAESTYYAVLYQPAKGFVVQYRAGLQASTIVSGTLPAGAEMHPFLAIQRQGDQFQAATSTDGSHFTLIPGSTVALAMPTRVEAGLAISSDQENAAITAHVTRLSFNASHQTWQAPASAHACPSGWLCQDSGNPAIIGTQVQTSADKWTISGNGTDIWSNNDQFRLVAQSTTGDATISAQIVGQTQRDPEAKVGLMFRQSSDANAPYYAALLTPAQGLLIQFRSVQGLLTDQMQDSDPLTAVLHQQQRTALRSPLFVKVSRWNDIFTTYTSSDGNTWLPVPDSSISITMPATILTGMAVTSHQPQAQNTAHFANVAVSNTSIPAPTACPLGWGCTDIGFPAPAGSQIVSSNLWTLVAGGYEIEHSYDAFHFVWQQSSGNITVQARVLAEHHKAGVLYTKGGVMIRGSTDPSAPYYALFVLPTQGMVVQYRTTPGGLTSEIHLGGGPGMFLKIVRVGDTFFAFTSTDTSTWVPVPAATVQLFMSGQEIAGLAATSDDNGSLATVTFDNVLIQQG